jgi:uncharacterized protein (DUF302 family)
MYVGTVGNNETNAQFCLFVCAPKKVLVQDKQDGRVITVIDNRASLTAQRLSGESAEGQKAFANLLSGGGK